MKGVPDSGAHPAHLSIEETLVVAFGIVDAYGVTHSNREGLVDPALRARVSEKIETCEHCRALARAAQKSFRPGGAPPTPSHETIAIDSRAVPRRSARAARRRQRQWLGVAATFLLAPLALYTLGAGDTLYALEGWRPVRMGEPLQAHDSARRLTMYSGFQKTGEILVHPRSSVTIAAMDPGLLEMELHDGIVVVSVTDMDQADVVRVRAGQLITESASDESPGSGLVLQMEAQSEATPIETAAGSELEGDGETAESITPDIMAIHVREGAIICQTEDALEPTFLAEGARATIRIEDDNEATIKITSEAPSPDDGDGIDSELYN